jgi:hypothetical protein
MLDCNHNRFTSDAIDFAKCSGMNLLSGIIRKTIIWKPKTILIVFILSLVWPHCLWQKKNNIDVILARISE